MEEDRIWSAAIVTGRAAVRRIESTAFLIVIALYDIRRSAAYSRQVLCTQAQLCM